jgi:predicted AAA+ superfamily ATPase
MEAAAFKTAALQWALEHAARTPRTARQFADEMAAKQK